MKYEMFPCWALVFRSFLLPPLVARAVVAVVTPARNALDEQRGREEGERRESYCACSVNFSLIRETAGRRLEKKQKNTLEKNNGSSIRDNLSSHFFFCYLNGSSCGVFWSLASWCGRKLFSKCKRLYKRLRVVSCDCLGDRCRWCYFWRMQVACRRAQTNWIVYFYRVIALSSYWWSYEVLTFL